MHLQSLKQKYFLDARKPPIGRTSRIIRNLESTPTNDLVLKIDEDILKIGQNLIHDNHEPKKEISTQTSPFLSSFKKLANMWNSEESINRSNGTTDEDNK